MVCPQNPVPAGHNRGKTVKAFAFAAQTRKTGVMLLLLLICGFYLFGLLIARGVTRTRQAGVSGIAVGAAALVATLTLWLLARTAMIEPWLAIAMIGTVALPALMIGAGLLAGSWIRHSHGSRLSWMVAALPVLACLVLPFLG